MATTKKTTKKVATKKVKARSYRARYTFPHPTMLRVASLPGPALTDNSYNGFGKALCVSIDEDGAGEVFEQQQEQTSDGGTPSDTE